MSQFQTCPKCRALLTPGTKVCPYCEAGQATALAPTPEQDEAATHGLGIWIIGACVVLYMLMVVLDPGRGDKEGHTYQPTHVGIETFGAHNPRLVQGCGQWWRIVSANFVHLDLMHLLMNSIAAFILIPMAGAAFGLHRTWVIYIASGVISIGASNLADNGGAGASGALCGLVMALAIWGYRRGGFEGRMVHRRMLMWAGFILILGFVPFLNVDNVAHGIGFVAGAAFGWPASGPRAYGGRADRIWRFFSYTGLLLVIVVAGAFLAPNVLRGQERREVEIYNDSIDRTLRSAIRMRRDRRPDSSLPSALESGPADAQAVRAAVNHVINLMRSGAPLVEVDKALDVANDRWRDWQVRLFCSHGMRLG